MNSMQKTITCRLLILLPILLLAGCGGQAMAFPRKQVEEEILSREYKIMKEEEIPVAQKKRR